MVSEYELVNPFMPSGLFLPYGFGQVHFLYKGCLIIYISLCFVEISELKINRIDPDQTPPSATSDLGLHCQYPFYRTLGINGLRCFGCDLRRKKSTCLSAQADWVLL